MRKILDYSEKIPHGAVLIPESLTPEERIELALNPNKLIIGSMWHVQGTLKIVTYTRFSVQDGMKLGFIRANVREIGSLPKEVIKEISDKYDASGIFNLRTKNGIS